MSEKKKNEILKDERFAHLFNNPRYKKVTKKENKVKIDDRFKSMFKDDNFRVKYTVDKYGRQQVGKTSADELKKYYEQESSDSSDDEEERKRELAAIEGNAKLEKAKNLPTTLQSKLKNLEIDYLRGEGVLQSSSSDEESSEDENDVFIEHVWGDLDADADKTDDSSRRLACMHMDWDRIRAVDILVLCNSFIPAGAGSILSVKIYPSEFGKERMAKEELQGPQELRKQNSDDEEEEAVDEESEEYREKLREYQLNRLKYFYAVIEFDSVKTADIVYKECDGLEYESTANRLDLRFIPDDVEFDDEPKDSCTEIPEKSHYTPRVFATTALQQAKVQLTWDETDVGRKELAEKLFSDKKNEINERDLKKYVAFSSESENSENSEESDIEIDAKNSKNKVDLYKSLLSEINQKEEEKKKKQVEMEYSWSIGDVKKNSEDENDETLTPFEKIIESKKQKKKERKMKKNQENDKGYESSDFEDIDMNDPFFAEEFENDEYVKPKSLMKKQNKKKNRDLEVDEDAEQAKNELELLLDDGDDGRAHFSLKKIQDSEKDGTTSKKKKKKLNKKKKPEENQIVDNFEIDVKDQRFSAIYDEADFNIDPTSSSFKKTKAMDTLIHEKLKRRAEKEEIEEKPTKKSKNDVSLKMLVKSLKRKTAGAGK